MTKLVKTSNTADINGNPWVCDCLMFNTILSWCRDTSADLELVCLIPPKFKVRARTVYDEVGSFTDDCITDIAEKMGGIVMNNDKLVPNIIYEESQYNGNFKEIEN